MKIASSFVVLLFMSLCSYTQSTIQWQRTLGGSETDGANYVQETDDGGYIVAGYHESSDGDLEVNQGLWDIWIVKLNAGGNIEWQKSIGGPGYETVRSIRQTSDGGYVFAGWSRSSLGDLSVNYGGNDIWVVKLDGEGEIIWEHSYGNEFHNKANLIRQTSDGGFIITGFYGTDIGGDAYVLKLDAMGLKEWERILGGEEIEEANSIVELREGGYALTGLTKSSFGELENRGGFDCLVVKLSEDGETEWVSTYGGSEDDIGNSIVESMDGSFVVAGSTKSIDGDVSMGNGGVDVWVLKIDSFGNIVWEKTYGGSGFDFAISIEETIDAGYIIAGTSTTFDESPMSLLQNENCWIIKLRTDGLVHWEQRFGGSGDDFGNYIQQTKDEGFIATGFTYSADGDFGETNGDRDMWIMKLFPVRLTGLDKAMVKDARVYPNPACNLLTIDVALKYGTANYQMVNVDGREVASGQITSDISDINIEKIPLGYYILYITTKDEIALSTFIKIQEQ